MCSLRLLSASSNCPIAIEQPEENAQQVGNAARGSVETTTAKQVPTEAAAIGERRWTWRDCRVLYSHIHSIQCRARQSNRREGV